MRQQYEETVCRFMSKNGEAPAETSEHRSAEAKYREIWINPEQICESIVRKSSVYLLIKCTEPEKRAVERLKLRGTVQTLRLVGKAEYQTRLYTDYVMLRR